MTIVKGQMKFLDKNGVTKIRHPETSASIVRMDGLSSLQESDELINENDSALTAIAKLNLNINSIKKTISSNPYDECSTPSEVQIKQISIENFNPVKGTRISILFKYLNSAEHPKLSVNSDEAKDIYYRGYPIPKEAIQENSLFDLIFDGEHWNIVGSIVWTS